MKNSKSIVFVGSAIFIALILASIVFFIGAVQIYNPSLQNFQYALPSGIYGVIMLLLATLTGAMVKENLSRV